MNNKRMMPDAKFYTARRCTRWDVYPQAQPLTAVAHDWYGFWTFDTRAGGGWSPTPTAYVLGKEITRDAAEAMSRRGAES